MMVETDIAVTVLLDFVVAVAVAVAAAIAAAAEF